MCLGAGDGGRWLKVARAGENEGDRWWGLGRPTRLAKAGKTVQRRKERAVQVPQTPSFLWNGRESALLEAKTREALGVGELAPL